MFVVRFITKFGESLPPCQKNSAQVLQSAPGGLGSGATNWSVNLELICPLYILWSRRVREGSDPSSHDPRPVVVRPATGRRTISAVVTRRATRRHVIFAVVARPCTRCLVLRTRHRPIFFKFPYPSSSTTDPSSRAAYPSSRPFSHPPRTRLRQPYKYARVFFFPVLCQSIPACTCHGDCLQDSPQSANYFSLHVIHHH